MTALIRLHDSIFSRLESAASWVIPTLARLVFAGVLLVYYWNSAKTKVSDSILVPASSAYYQIFPRAVESAGGDISQLNALHQLVALAGTWAEFLLPLLIVAGLFTRLAALGMIGFIAVQSWVDVFGHNLAADDIGTWFDRDASSLLADQRAFWIFVLLILVLRGAGPLSLDRLLARFR